MVRLPFTNDLLDHTEGLAAMVEFARSVFQVNLYNFFLLMSLSESII